jgi:uncharacterized protein (DUF488 family)
MKATLFTIGHSIHAINDFMGLLRQHDITALVDVRSHPYSRYTPQFSREPLKMALAAGGISYVFLGKELGARSDNPACYWQGKVQYERLAQESLFIEGIARVVQGMEFYRIAIMCAEKDPIDCHRALLVARKIFGAGYGVNHILADGSIETQRKLESRLLALCKRPEGDWFRSRDECTAEAYSIQSQRVAYKDEAMEHSNEVEAV